MLFVCTTDALSGKLKRKATVQQQFPHQSQIQNSAQIYAHNLFMAMERVHFQTKHHWLCPSFPVSVLDIRILHLCLCLSSRLKYHCGSVEIKHFVWLRLIALRHHRI